MADPLQTTAESFAPARATTNFFDPSQSQDVLSRYAVAGRNVAEQEKTAELASRLAATRSQRAEERNRAADRELNLEAQRRQNVRWGREDDEYAAKKDFEATRAGVIVGISDALRDSVGTDQFLDKLTRLQSELAPEAREDDAIKSIVTLYSREHDFMNMERKQNEQLNRRANLAARAKAALTPQELAELPTDQYGVPDTDALLEATARKEGEQKVLKAQEKAKEEATTKAAAEAKTAETKKAQAEEKVASEGVKDADAFPSRVAEYLARSGFTREGAEAAPKPEYEAAKRFDENRLAQESMAALNYEEDEYVDILDDERKKAKKTPLTKAQKDARRAVWWRAKRLNDALNPDSNEEGTDAPEPAAAPSTAPAPATLTPAQRLRQLQGK
jgi:hypothetical protein